MSTTTGTTEYTLHGKNIVHMAQGASTLHFYYDAQNRPAVVTLGGTDYAYLYKPAGRCDRAGGRQRNESGRVQLRRLGQTDREDGNTGEYAGHGAAVPISQVCL